MNRRIFAQCAIFFFLIVGLTILLSQPPKAFAGLCFNDSNCSCNSQCSFFTCSFMGPQNPQDGCLSGSHEYCENAYYYYTDANGAHQYSFVPNCQDPYSDWSSNNGCYDNGNPAYVFPRYEGCRVGSNCNTSTNINGQCNTNFWAQQYGSNCDATAYCAPNGDLAFNDCLCVKYCNDPSVNPYNICGNGAQPRPGYGIITYTPNDTTLYEVGCNAGSLNYGQTVCFSPKCNSGSKACGSWSSPPLNSCYSGNINRTCTHNTYTNGGSTYNTCYEVNFTDYSTSYNCNAGAGYYACLAGNCVTNIYVHVYKDYNHDGIKNGNDAGLANVTVTDNGGNFPKTDGTGSVTFSDKATGTYNITMTVPAGYAAVGATTKSVSLTNTAGNQTVNFYLTPLYSVSGNVFYDDNHNQNYDGSDTLFNTNSTTIHVTGGPTSVADMTQSDGTYNTPQTLEAGTYTFSITSTLPTSYTYTTPKSWSVTVGDPTGQIDCNVGSSPDAVCGNPQNGSISNLNFGVDRPYQISGRIFNDVNLDNKYDGSDTTYTGGSTVTITGPTNETINAASGIFTTGQTLLPGTYTVSYNTSTTPLPAGYKFTTPNTYTVIVGYNPACNVGGSLDAICTTPNTSSIANLDFGLTNEHTHQGSVCLDVRTDNNSGTIDNQFPPPPATCGGENGSQAIIDNGSCSTGSGIVFSCDGTFDFGLGSADANNWTVGGSGQDTECYSGGGLNVIPTSYDYLLTTARESNITPTNLDNLVNPNPNTSCTTTDCVLPANLPKGIYQVNGDLTLDAANYTFPAPADPSKTSQAYIILVHGNLKINGNIYVPRGSVVVFSASGDIHVDKSVGNVVSDPNSATVNTPNLEGVYSADQSFYVDSYGSGLAICNLDGTPLDKRLYVLGVVITNAAKGGGSFVNNRDLCIYDNNCSAVEVGDGGNGGDGMGGSGEGTLFNYLLNLMADGQFLSNKNFNWQELKP